MLFARGEEAGVGVGVVLCWVCPLDSGCRAWDFGRAAATFWGRCAPLWPPDETAEWSPHIPPPAAAHE